MTIQEEIFADIDWRNGELAELRVILHKAKLTQTQRVTYIKYIVPAIYALWEGFIKNSLELLSKEINKTNVPITDLHENLLTHAIISIDKLALDRPRIRFKTQKDFSLYFCEHIGKPFPTIGKLPTKSNVNSEVLQDLFNRFNLGIIEKVNGRRLDKLLTFRNTIAHGDNSIPVTEDNINEFVLIVQDLMLLVFEKIDNAIKNKTFLREISKDTSGSVN